MRIVFEVKDAEKIPEPHLGFLYSTLQAEATFYANHFKATISLTYDKSKP